MTELTDTTAIVVGASRGLGRGIATALAETGAPVVAVARTAEALHELPGVQAHVGDAADPATSRALLERHEPQALVVAAGARPPVHPLHEQTWESFSVNWHADVQIAFHWLREALVRPLRPGGRVIVVSSGAALNGSPLSGGYAGAKATQRFIAAYAREESERAGLGLTFTTILPRITPLTGLGRPAVEAYAARAGRAVHEYLAPFGPPVTPEIAGAAVVELLRTDAAAVAPEYLLAGGGLKTLA